MVTVPELWLPILLSTITVFIASAIMHSVLGYHASDVVKMDAEDEVLDAIRRNDVPPGDYAMPHVGGMEEMKSPEYVQKRSAGPVAFVTVMKGGPVTMSRELTGWFVYCLIVSIFAAYIAGRALESGTVDYLEVFRFAGTVAFAGYGLAVWQETIWFGRKWSTSLKNTFDALVYALITAGIFGWLWPAATV